MYEYYDGLESTEPVKDKWRSVANNVMEIRIQ